MRISLALTIAFVAAFTTACSDPIGGEEIPPGCGDGVKSAAEECDGADLGGGTCATAAAPGWQGTVSCTQSCRLNTAACITPATTWNPMTADRWRLYDVGVQIPAAQGFISSAFDGRFLYFVPYKEAISGVVTRFDTQGDFGNPQMWTTFDVASTNAAAKGFFGGAFDGRYVYFVPHSNGAYDGTVARYDTKGRFDDASAWATFDVSSVNSSAKGFATAAFDGRYLYLAPYHNNADYSGTVARYDTQAEFGKAESWATFDVSTADAGAKGFLGAAFDGRYLYLVPFRKAVGGVPSYHGTVARYDTRASAGFAAKESWTTFNVEGLPGNPMGFWGVAFDGRHLYLVQHRRTLSPPPPPPALAEPTDGWVARYDTQAPFAQPTSWKTFHVTGTVDGNARGFCGATFDGRYIYLVPSSNDVAPGLHGNVARYDTFASFDVRESWVTFNLASKDAKAIGYSGAGFDGRYVYLVPRLLGGGASHGLVARFDAKSPSWLPVGWNRAFD